MDIQPVPSRAGLTESTARQAVAFESDGHLLERFLSGQDEDAFALIVHRHGRVVLHLCRRILGNGHDAEDAFQATFLVLARKASAVRQPDALGSWLCGVAMRVSLRLKSRRSRRRATELEASSLPRSCRLPSQTVNNLPDPLDGFPAPANRSNDPVALAAWSDDEAVLTEELAHLPERYRAPLVLYYLEGQTTERAAVQLRCPVGTFKSRLAKARDLIRSRLTRRGVVLTSTLLTGLLAGGVAQAVVPPSLLHATASLVGPSATAIAPRVAALAQEALNAMRPKFLLGSIVAVALVVLLGVFLIVRQSTPVLVTAPGSIPPANVRPGPTLVVANQRCGTVTLIDVGTGKIRFSVAADPCPHEVAVSPDGTTVAVACYGLPFGRQPGNTIKLIDVAAGKIKRIIDLGKYTAPHGVQWLDEDRLLCTSETSQALLEIDVNKGEVVRALEAGPNGPHMLAVAADGTRAYATNVGSNAVSVFDLTRGVKVCDVEAGNGTEGIALSPDGRRLWVGNQGDRTVSVIDTAELRVVKTLPAPGLPFRIAFSPDGKTAIVTEPASRELTVYETTSLQEVKRIKLDQGPIKFDLRGPITVAFAPDGKVVYCSMFASNAVAVVDLEKGKVVAKFSAGIGPDGIAFASLGAAD